MHIQTHILDALQGYDQDVHGISFILHLDSYSHHVHENLSFLFLKKLYLASLGSYSAWNLFHIGLIMTLKNFLSEILKKAKRRLLFLLIRKLL